MNILLARSILPTILLYFGRFLYSRTGHCGALFPSDIIESNVLDYRLKLNNLSIYRQVMCCDTLF